MLTEFSFSTHSFSCCCCWNSTVLLTWYRVQTYLPTIACCDMRAHRLVFWACVLCSADLQRRQWYVG